MMGQFADFVEGHIPGGRPKVTAKGNVSTISVCSKRAVALAHLLYSDSQVYLTRKFLKAQEILHSFQHI